MTFEELLDRTLAELKSEYEQVKAMHDSMCIDRQTASVSECRVTSQGTMMDVKYHLNCYCCGYFWWSENPFPDCCPRCKAKR